MRAVWAQTDDCKYPRATGCRLVCPRRIGRCSMGWESASTASVGAAALHMHEAGGEVQWSGKKFSGVFERRRRMKIYRPLAMLTGVCARYKKLG